MLGGVLGRYIQGDVTLKGALLFSVYGIHELSMSPCWHTRWCGGPGLLQLLLPTFSAASEEDRDCR